MIFQGAPGELIAYADSDVYFFPGWLEKHLEVMETFPEVGTVSGLPRRQRTEFCKHTLERVHTIDGMQVEEGNLIPEDWIRDHALSLDKVDQLERDLERTDTRVTFGGVQAYVTATHFQFLVRKSDVEPYLPFAYTRPMGPDVAQFDRAIDGSGRLRLAVAERMVYHIGNVYDEAALARVVGESKRVWAQPAAKKRRSILHRGPVKRVLMRLYDWLFQLYFE